ncbi:DVU_1557 family redox protein [Desulfonema limicola]|uniref:DVU_1557 family redox protein n=1 Tax=Desulfonema limicola TaxID=45656 RepID=UPI001A9B4224|nr:CLJU_RS11820 family redox protein [Desulfonema limicola]
MTNAHVQPEDLKWKCFQCSVNLISKTVSLEYMNNRFSTELPVCPDCGFVMISEEVALGKMAEVEQILEDK